MVDAVLVVLRETLEAALYILMLLVMSRKLSIALTWTIPALLIGIIGSWGMAQYAYEIADALEGTGQEWTNAFLYLCVTISFSTIAWIVTPLLFGTPNQVEYLVLPEKKQNSQRILLITCAICSVGFSIAREITEIWIYLGGFVNEPEKLQSALIGSALGLWIGMSIGVITYYLLVYISAKKFLYLLFTFLVFLCGGISMQIAKQLMQIGVLESAPLWNISSILNEYSWLGELLYELIGYSSSPSAVQIIFYWLSVIPLLSALLWSWYRKDRKPA